MIPRTSSLSIAFATLGLSLTACEEKAADADLVSLAERVAVLESQVGDAPTDDGDALADRVTALEDDLGEAQADIVETTTLVSENQVDIALNDAAILDVEEDLALAEADIAENETAISETNAAVAALEAVVTALEETLATLDADLLALADEVGDNADAIDLLQDAYTDVLTQITDIDLAIAAIDVTAITELVDGVSEDLADLETDLDADIADIETDVADLQDRGEVWYDEGTGTGTCARADVVTNSDRPLIFMATVETEVNTSGSACYTNSSSYYSCSSYSSSFSESQETSVSVVAANVGGTSFSETVSRSEFLDNYVSNGSTVHYNLTGTGVYSGAYAKILLSQDLDKSWTTPVQGVLEIPSAGTYTVEVQVTSTATAGTCRLVVFQP